MSETKIKICGLSTPETVDAAVDAGATHIGLVHYEPSPRHLSLEDAAKLRRRIPPSVKVVLLLVNMEAVPTAQAIDAVKPDVIQFHGGETPEWLALIKDKTPFEVWKAWGVRSAESLAYALCYKGAVDVARQQPNVFRMKLLGAEVVAVESGAKTLKDAMNEALRHWVANVHDTFYIIGTVAGPHPYPELVRDFQSVIGREAREQIMAAEGRLPDLLVAAIGGGSNAIGLFHPFLDDPEVAMLGIEAAGHGIETGQHAASLTGGAPGVLHGNKTYLLQDEDGQITEAHSISAGLDYPGIGPEHSWLHESGRVKYLPITDREALEAFQLCSQLEGIIPALESAHALAALPKVAKDYGKDQRILVNVSGRGDKDIFTVAEHLGVKL